MPEAKRILGLFILPFAAGLIWLAWYASGGGILIREVRELGLMKSCKYVHATGIHQETLFFDRPEAWDSFHRPCDRTIRARRTANGIAWAPGFQ